jgi:hypothetical protein
MNNELLSQVLTCGCGPGCCSGCATGSSCCSSRRGRRIHVYGLVNGRQKRTRRLNTLKNYRLCLLVAVGFDDVVRPSSKEHVAAAAVAAAAASADKLPRKGCGHFKRLKDNPFNDPGVTCYFLLSSLQCVVAVSVWRGLTRLGAVQRGSVWRGAVRFGAVWRVFYVNLSRFGAV